jgi:hypothetical protein
MSRAAVDNVGDAKQVENAERIEREQAKNYAEALERIAATQDGAAVFAVIVERAGFFRTSFDTDALVMAHNEGRRSFGTELLNDWLAAKPDAMAVLLTARVAQETRHG